MTIIAYNYEKILKEMIFNQFSVNLKEKLNKSFNKNNVFNYIDIISNLDQSLCEIALNSLKVIFTSLDKAYCSSKERKSKYHIKAYTSRTILTIFGEITFTRTTYVSKVNGKSFCFLDRYLGLEKYDYFDPYIKASVIEETSNTSIPIVCKKINDLIGNRVSIQAKEQYLTRQTVRNIILKSIISDVEIIDAETPDNLYIMLDEKWVHTQRNDGKDIMIKSMVTFENSINGKLINKHIFAGKNNECINKCLNFIYQYYNLDKIKNIYFMGDGAKWIKAVPAEFKINNVTNILFCLDKFHFKQALHHICLDKDLEEIFEFYVLNNDRKNFKLCCDALIESNPHRSKTIEEKKIYILNNWKPILNLYNNNLKCPMESQISHNIAYLFTSRPKGYSIKMLDKILELRLLNRNNHNIKQLFLNNINNSNKLTINQENLNMDYLNKDKDNTPYSIKNVYSTINKQITY